MISLLSKIMAQPPSDHEDDAPSPMEDAEPKKKRDATRQDTSQQKPSSVLYGSRIYDLYPSCQERLLRAAKARIDRMVAPKSRRKDLEAPEWLASEWKSGDKTAIARVLQEENFDKESRLHVRQ